MPLLPTVEDQLQQGLNRVLSQGEVDGLLDRAESALLLLGLGQLATDGASLLGSDVDGDILLASVELADVRLLGLTDHGVHASDRLADVLAK